MKEYFFTTTKEQIPEEFVSLHDVQIERILSRDNTVVLTCRNCYQVVKSGKVSFVKNGVISIKGFSPSDYSCHVFYGKPTAAGEVLIGLPISLEEMDCFLQESNTVIELFQEYYSPTGILFKGNIFPLQITLGGVSWKHVTIEIMENPTIEYTGLFCSDDQAGTET